MPTKPKRPKISYIQIFFEDRPPIIVDPNTVCCITWGDAGEQVLEGFYHYKDEPKKVAETKAIWEGKPTGKAVAVSMVSGLVKTLTCDPQGIP